MSMYDKAIKTSNPNRFKPIIFFYMGYWRVSDQPRAVSRNPKGTRAGWWADAHTWVGHSNGQLVHDRLREVQEKVVTDGAEE